MKKSTKILTLTTVSLALLAITIVFVLKRRGKKVYLNDKYRQNSAYRIWILPDVEDYDNGKYFDGILDYVVLKPNAGHITGDNGEDMVAVHAVGINFSNRVRRMKLDGTYYIDTKYLDL